MGKVEQWHREVGDTIANFVNDNSRNGKPTYSAEIAQLIADHAPTPATVERFTVYEFKADHWAGSGAHTRRPIGEVVASPDGEGGWLVKLPNWRHWVCLTDNAYRALVDHNTKAGIWERTND